MAGLEELKKKLQPLFDADKGFSDGLSSDPCDSYMGSDGSTVNLLSQTYGVYNINELGLHKRTGCPDESDDREITYRCASNEMHVFGAIGYGASSVVQRAIHIPFHRIIALKRINIFEKEKRQQLLNEIRTMCEAPRHQGLVEFHGAFFTPDSGQISIALEYMDGGSLSDILRERKFIPEPVLSCMTQKLLHGLCYLHGTRHLVHRDIKPANLLINLKGEPKITDFGISADLEGSVAMCATFVGTVTYMSPERIRNERYSYPADIWSLGVSLLECGTGQFPFSACEGPVNLMLQILYDPAPTPPRNSFSPEFCSFVDACLQKDADLRPTAEQLLAHPFIKKHENSGIDLAVYIRDIIDPTHIMKELADMFTVHYYMLLDGPDDLWAHARTFYTEESYFSFSDKTFTGATDIFSRLSSIRSALIGSQPRERLVHVVEKLQCRRHGDTGVSIRASGSFIIGSHFLICGDGVQAEGMPSMRELPAEVAARRLGSFREQFTVEPGRDIGCFFIVRQELYIRQP